MISFIFSKLALITRVRIPTILGLGVVLLGLGAGIYLVAQNQTLTTRASADQTPQNITVSNLSDSQASISWQTSTPSTGFVNLGVSSTGEQTALDDRDQTSPKSYYTHHVTLDNLNAQTTYQFKVISGKSGSPGPGVQRFTTKTTANSLSKPVIGTVLDKNQPLNDAIAYLSITTDITQSAIVKGGNFIIPVASSSKGNPGKITIVSSNGSATILIWLDETSAPIGPFKLGDNLDLTVNTPPESADLLKYDLTGDGLINSLDYSVMLRNFGHPPVFDRETQTESAGGPQDKRADLNGDGIVDQKDLSEMSKKITGQKR